DDANAIGLSKFRGVVVSSRDSDRSDQEKPVDPRDVYLVVKDLGGVDDLNLWEVGQLDDLRKQLKSCRDHRLTSDNGRKDCNYQARIEHAWWGGAEEGVRVCPSIAAYVGSLANVLG
ncbi:MAG: hypothetical protein Q9164_007885, partial [Protoblastenia rupestris]